jgi:hypothetical protein
LGGNLRRKKGRKLAAKNAGVRLLDRSPVNEDLDTRGTTTDYLKPTRVRGFRGNMKKLVNELG